MFENELCHLEQNLCAATKKESAKLADALYKTAKLLMDIEKFKKSNANIITAEEELNNRDIMLNYVIYYLQDLQLNHAEEFSRISNTVWRSPL